MGTEIPLAALIESFRDRYEDVVERPSVAVCKAKRIRWVVQLIPVLLQGNFYSGVLFVVHDLVGRYRAVCAFHDLRFGNGIAEVGDGCLNCEPVAGRKA